MRNQHLNILKCRGQASGRQIREMAKIATHYFPDQRLMEQITRTHLEKADSVVLALEGDKIIGFSIASKYKMLSPFCAGAVNTNYQRMLYLDPEVLYHGMGRRLVSATMRDLFGYLWPIKRLLVFCRTQNPVVVRLMNTFTVSYPQYRQVIPAEIQTFAENLLPILDAEEVDNKFRLVGTMKAFEGMDYSDIWNRYLGRRGDEADKLMLDSVFSKKDGRIINNGSFMLIIAYARPFNFIRYLFHH